MSAEIPPSARLTRRCITAGHSLARRQDRMRRDNYHAACMLASFHDQETAARIRFEHRIPTLFPKSMAAQAGLQRCEWCGRPWQADPEGACEHCPRLMWGPAPRSAEQARKGPAPIEVTRDQMRPAPQYDD